jgi:hypothetical protein
MFAVNYRPRMADEAVAQVDTLRKFVEALGGTLRVEVECGDERIQIA